MIKVLHVFTEEASARNVFESILPRLLPQDVNYRIYSHQGKQDLEKAIQKTIPSISRIPGSKILITRDQDSSDCVNIKNNIINLLSNKCVCDFYVRIVCRELESWFLGDLSAIQKAFPRFKAEQHMTKADLRNVDKITNANKYLLKIIPEYSHRENLPKLEVSESISKYLDLNKNTSTSFNHTLRAIKNLVKN
ncbi:MAG: DUF4276 family protein [Saprospiraceae bacterium]|jgi:hypothetical protein|nr:DUF4276 family protein [Saprospiraceae bacterium]